MKLSHRGNGCPRTSHGEAERAAGFLVLLEFFNRADKREAPALIGERFADGSAIRRDGKHGSVEHLLPTKAVEFLLGNDGVGTCGKLESGRAHHARSWYRLRANEGTSSVRRG